MCTQKIMHTHKNFAQTKILQAQKSTRTKNLHTQNFEVQKFFTYKFFQVQKF